jgi:hypothetical protein
MNKIIFLMIFLTFLGCKPTLPTIADYPDNYPCFAYDKCKTLQAYGGKEDCKLELQKCFYYSDYQKCEKMATEDEKNKCYNKISIRY